jgi:hypothetical protein
MNYKVITFPSYTVEQRLNEFARQGWRCVAAWDSRKYGNDNVTVILEKPTGRMEW